MSDTHSLTVLSMLKISYLILCPYYNINVTYKNNKMKKIPDEKNTRLLNIFLVRNLLSK